MENSQQFITATETVKKLNIVPSNDELGSLYGLYKQATSGDINITKPSFFQIKELMKWNNWNNNKGMTVYEAEVGYIKFVNSMIKKYGLSK
jgi:diazepam-binding inhibitor (GABA receptor modulating acyl-CoA-binding protein)